MSEVRLEVDLGPGVRAAFTTSVAGNLGLQVGDDPAAVAARRAVLDAWAGAPVHYLRQVHGAAVHRCDVPGDGEVDADAQVTTAEVPLAVLVADCVPVLLADPTHRVVAAVHAGRRGVVAGVVPAALAAMVRAGASPGDVRAVVGPAICASCYEVPPALRDEVDRQVPGTAATTSWGTASLDLPGAVRRQLTEAGVQVRLVDACTRTDPRWYSHRASGEAGSARPPGRFAAVVRLAPGVSPRSSTGPGLA